MNLPSHLPRISDIVEDYNKKVAAAAEVVAAYERAGTELAMAACIGGTYGDRISTGHVSEIEIKRSLIKSAWRYVYDGLSIARISSAADRKKFEQALADPPPFTMENITATFGDYVLNPRANILRGLAEAFCSLDQAYKSHEKVRIGVKGLPKRVILTNVGGYGAWGQERLKDVLNALAAYQRKPLVEWAEINAILKDGEALKETRGVWLKRFSNGNGHLFFAPQELRDINMGLAEYYGDVLPDASEDRPAQKQASTAVSKDLQYYPTPKAVVDRILDDLYRLEGMKVLEPSCGCGRFMDALVAKGAEVLGVEVDAGRWEIARAKGHNVLRANFLETAPTGNFDMVVMNPPFYGKHYAKHVEHALKFLKPGGKLIAILPASARYDHGLLKGNWYDLPVGSFSESGTNINTSVLTVRKD